MKQRDNSDPDWGRKPQTRRALLTAMGATATSALAGCNQNNQNTPTPTPDVTLQDVRLVQTVEDSRLNNASGSISDPPLVANEYTTVLFDLSITNPGNLPTTMPVIVSSTPDYTNPTNFPVTSQLHKDDAQAIDSGADAPAVFYASQGKNIWDNPPPVFRIPKSVSEITVMIRHVDISGDSVTLTEGPNGDFQIGTLGTLRVGFLPVQDPGGVPNSNKPGVDWGDSNGKAKFYDRSVASSFSFLRRAYPSKIVAYKHGKHMRGNLRSATGPTATMDAVDAKTTLNKISNDSTFPSKGTILTEDVSPSKAVNMMDASQGGGFDVHVLICPQDTASGNQKYFDVHWGGSGPAGYFYGRKNAAVAAHEAQAGMDDNGHVATTAQEIGHYFANPLYSGAFKRTNSDQKHTNGNLVSTGYDLTDGSYTLINDFSVKDGSFNAGPVQTGPNGPTVETHQSYMSYGSQTRWADSRVIEYLIESDYSYSYGGGSAPARGDTDSTEGGLRTQEVQPVVDLFGTPVDGGVDIQSAAAYRATPGSTEYDPEYHTEAEPVDVVLQDPTGEVLHRTTVPDRVQGSHGHTHHPGIAVSLPFPPEGAVVHFDRGGETTRANPIVAPVRFALLNVPVPPFREGEATMNDLLESLRAVDGRMREQQYGDAADILAEEFASGVTDRIQPYEALANEPTPEQLLGLTERMIDRLHVLAEATEENQTPTATPTEVSVDPRATYLRTASRDSARDARPIELAELGIEPGQRVTLRRLGSYSKKGSGGEGLSAVFSANATLEPSEERHRVPGAIDAGPDYETSPTYFGDQPTDIPEDFLVSDTAGEDPSVTLEVPPEARFLFASAIDNRFADNSDDDGDFRLAISAG
jgi:hypothetical protein